MTEKTFFKLNQKYRMKFLPYQLFRAKATNVREPSRHVMVSSKALFRWVPFVGRLEALWGAWCHSELLQNRSSLVPNLISVLCRHVSVDASGAREQLLTAFPPYFFAFIRWCWNFFGFDKKGKCLQWHFKLSLWNNLRFEANGSLREISSIIFPQGFPVCILLFGRRM